MDTCRVRLLNDCMSTHGHLVLGGSAGPAAGSRAAERAACRCAWLPRDAAVRLVRPLDLGAAPSTASTPPTSPSTPTSRSRGRRRRRRARRSCAARRRAAARAAVGPRRGRGSARRGGADRPRAPTGRSSAASWFAQNFSEGFLLDAVLRQRGRVPAGEVAGAVRRRRDIADVAVAALTGDDHAGPLRAHRPARADASPRRSRRSRRRPAAVRLRAVTLDDFTRRPAPAACPERSRS